MRTRLLHSTDAPHDPTGVATDHGPERQSWIKTQRKLHSRFLCWMIGVAVICSLGTTAFGQAPANDNFANPQAITGLTGSAAGSNVNATLEPGEPTTTDGFSCTNSVWVQWTAPFSATVIFSLTANFSSQLAIYTGSSLASLTLKGEDESSGFGGDTVSLDATAGIVYRIRITSSQFFSTSGSFTLNWLPFTPLNDNVASAQQLNLYNGSIALNATNIGSGTESGEVSFPGLVGPGKSIWYQLFISANTTITISTVGSDFDTILSVFRRNNPGIGGLVPVGGDDDGGGQNASQVIFPASLSVGVYYIAVDGFNGAQGRISLSISSSTAQPNPIAGQGYERLVSFPDLRVAGLPNRGEAPAAQLISAANGFLYGTTQTGGESDLGTVFKMTVGGQLTTLVEFTGVAGNRRGSRPSASLLEAIDGNFYGTTRQGGASNLGTVFRITPGGSFTTLFEFTGASGSVKGADPDTAIVQAADGTLYGTTRSGGQSNHGTVFQIRHDGTFQTLVEFSGEAASFSGSGPAQLVAADGGGVYGTFFQRDPSSIFGAGGGIFRITPAGAYSEVHSFQASGGGYAPLGLTQGPDGSYYGVTANSPARDIFETDYPPIVFRYTPGGAVEILAFFPLYSSTSLYGFDHAGNLFGSWGAFGGGIGYDFKITPSGSNEILQEGQLIPAEARGYIRGADGNYFGMTFSGGFQDAGTVFRVSPDGEFVTLLEFSDQGFIDKGQAAQAGLVEHPDGFFYGTTSSGGNDDNGVIFKMAKDGTITKLVDFTGDDGSSPGRYPEAELLVGSDELLYGTTLVGGLSSGTLFKVTTQGGFEKMRDFSDFPKSPVIEANDGLLYGVSGSDGMLFRINKNGQNFQNLGNLPSTVGPLIQDSQDNIYGCTRYGGLSDHGYIYRRTSTGVIQTVAEFGQIPNGAAGFEPVSGLVQATDGKFYGTASEGGAFGFGTVYRVSGAGVLETVVSFMGPDGPLRGASPTAGLKAGANGWYYGTTSNGGIGNLGTIYRLKISGEFETLLDFAYYSSDGAAVGELCFGSDGNVYGARNDALFRLVLPGPPMIYSFQAVPSTDGAVGIQGKVNPRGSTCSVVVEYGENATISSPITVSIRSGLAGVKTTQMEKTLALLGGKKYYYRIRATNSSGVSVGPITAFTTPGPPVPLATAASGIGNTQAELNGTVDARYADTSVSFEFAPIGDDSPDLRAAVPALIRHDTDGSATVECAVANLAPGVTYYYRIMATNAAGTVFSGTQSFTTLTEPTATVATPTDVTSHSVVLNGSVTAHGSNTSVIFEYGSDANTFPFSVGATPSTVPGDTREVRASLSNLTQGATYFYRIKATSAGGIGYSNVGSFSLNILSGFARVFPSTPLAAQGTVLVNLTPANVGGWRFTGEQQWRSSGIPAGALTTGDRNIEFRPVAGYIQPPPETASVVSGGATTLVDRVYYETLASGSGGLSVTLKPVSLAAASVPEAERAQWRLLGDDDTQWRDSDTSLTGLLPGTYLVECKGVPSAVGRATPPISSVQVRDFQTTFPTLTYFLADAQTGALPTPVSFQTVTTDSPGNAYAYVGQIRSNLGSSSGFVVKQRVVATAGHVVFDDGKLAGVTGLQWLFQRQNGIYEPKPQEPRGFYLFNGYSAARREPGVIPGEGTTTSKNLDVAALYFVANATTNEPNLPGRGAFGGFLASDATVNEFLTSPAQKILVGYPVDGVSDSNQGLMHATAPLVGSPPQAVSFTRTFDRTYVTPDIRGSGGMSGGPLCILAQNGNYYPAAVYLGGTGQTIVRSIDSAVIDMFNRAQESGDDDSNNTGGGITLTSVSPTGTDSEPGAIKVTILPAAAASAGRWGLKPESSDRISGGTSSGRTAGEYILRFTTISGFQSPTSPTIRINGGALTEYTFTYAGLPPAITSANSATGRRGQPLTYQIVADQSPTSYSVSGNLPNGLTLNTDTGRISGTLQQAGVFTITLRATNAGGTGTRSLSLICRPAVSNQSATAMLGQPLSRQINSSESGADVSYSADDLPPGTSLNEETGLISGSPTQAGVFPSLVTVTKDGASASAILTFTVTATPLELWRMANFQTTSNIGNAADNADPDKDGRSNQDEYAAGTNPNSAADVFKILTTSKTAATFTVTAAGKASRSYVLERRASLAPGPWTAVISIGPLASDGPINLTDPATPANSAFYRLRVSAP